MLTELLSQFINFLLSVINELGYLGIFLGMVVESTIIPLPSEIILIPAGVLIAKGEMNFMIVLLAGTLGSLIGAIINYFLALFLGRAAIDILVSKYGKILFVNKDKIKNSEVFFSKYGGITTFIGRLIPGTRHLISLPAGFLRMNFSKFCLFTILGAGLWSTILILVGYFFGSNSDLISNNMGIVNILLVLFSIIIIFMYIFLKKRSKNRPNFKF